MGNRARVAILAACLAAAAVAAYFFAPSANRGPGPEVPAARPAEVPAARPAEATADPAPPALAAAGPRAEGVEARKPAPPTARSPRAVTFEGKVESAKDVPSVGAHVELRQGDAVLARAVTDAKGAYRLEAERPEGVSTLGLIVARDDAGRAAATPAWWRTRAMPDAPWQYPPTIQVWVLTLAATSSLDVLVKGPSGAPTAADVSIASVEFGEAVACARARAAADGRARFEGLALPRGELLVVAWAQGIGRGTAGASLPRESAAPVDVSMTALRDVDVTVVEAGSKAPIPGVALALTELVRGPSYSRTLEYLPTAAIAPTDASGRTRIAGIATAVWVRVAPSVAGFALSGEGGRGTDGVSLPPEATTLEIVLERHRRVTWEVASGEVAPPPDGTVLTARGLIGGGSRALPRDARMEAGRIVADDVPPGPSQFVVFAPNGTQARVWVEAGKAEGGPAKFVKTRRVDVALTWTDGTPAAGLWVSLRNQGNNPFGPPVATDAGGRASFEGLEAQMADVYVAADPQPWGGRRIASCRLESGDGHVEVRLPRRRELLLRVFLDGTPGLPEGVQPSPGPEVQVLESDASAGTMRLSVWPASDDAPTSLGLSAAGWTQDAPVLLPAPVAGAPSEARVDLHRTGALTVTVVPPPDGRYRLRLERWDAEAAEWRAAGFDSQMFGPGQAQVDANHRWALSTVRPGRHRVAETYSGMLSAAVEIVAGTAPAALKFDLSAVDWVSGRVEFPDGEPVTRVTVATEPEPPPDPWGAASGTSTDGEGKFRVRVPGDRDLVLRARHLFLVPAPVGGRVPVRGGMKDVVLKLVRGPVAKVRFDREPKYWMNPGQAHTEKAHLWRGPPVGPPEATVSALVEGSTARFGNFEPGTWTVMLDLSPCAPVVIENAALGAGETELGPVTLSNGTSLVFEVRVPAGQSAPRISVFASRIDGKPAYQRFGELGGDRGRIPGLGRGRFKVTAMPVMGGHALLLDREIDVDGTTDVSLVLEPK